MIEIKREQKRDCSLDYIRVIAMIMIVLCHFFQIIHLLELAFWLNTGVQIFLILSASLMIKKRFENAKDVLKFYKDKLLRIMMPVWIYLIAICLVLVLIKYPLSMKSVVVYALGGAAFIKSGVLGLGHFWYISIILIAYLLVPLLSLFSDKMMKISGTLFSLVCIVIFAVLTTVFGFVSNASYGVNISLFVVSYYVFQRYGNVDNFEIKTAKIIVLPSLTLVALRVVLELYQISDWEYYHVYDAVFVPVCKSFLALLLFAVLYIMFSKQYFRKFDKAVLIVSSLSFEVYITHQFIELSVYEFIPYCSNGTVLAGIVMLTISIVLIALNTVALRLAEKVVSKLISVVKK